MINPLKVWTQPIARARVLLNKSLAEDAVNLEEPVELLDMFQQGSELERTTQTTPLISKMKMIQRASRHYHTALINQVLTNMELLAFGISWFGMVSHLGHLFSQFILQRIDAQLSGRRILSLETTTGWKR
jgi:hypothetical protein